MVDVDEQCALTEVPCTLSAPVYLRVPETAATISGGRRSIQLALSMEEASTKERKSGCKIVDVTLRHSVSRAPVPIHYLVFRNKYTHSITVKYLTDGSRAEPASWGVCVRDHVLMPNCHCAQGSQSWTVLNIVGKEEEMKKVTQLRLILRQPSPQWKEFGIEQFTCYTSKYTTPQTSPTDMTRTDDIASKLEYMVSLVKEGQKCHW